MAAIRSRGNKDTELKLASILRAHGITGWRRSQRLPGKPDFVFRRQRLAVFVDGCFWHGCPRCTQAPKNNAAYWRAKASYNKRRDAKVGRELRERGLDADRAAATAALADAVTRGVLTSPMKDHIQRGLDSVPHHLDL